MRLDGSITLEPKGAGYSRDSGIAELRCASGGIAATGFSQLAAQWPAAGQSGPGQFAARYRPGLVGGDNAALPNRKTAVCRCVAGVV